MAAEDLEMVIRATDAWRGGADFFTSYASIESAGAAFFRHDAIHWESELRRLLLSHLPTDLSGVVGPAMAARLRAAADGSVVAAAADIALMDRQIPGNVREALRRYKHGLVFLLPSVAPIPTNAIGLTRLAAAAAGGGFLVWSKDGDTTHQTGILFACTDAELDAAMSAVDHAAKLAQWIESWLLLEAEGGRGWGLALYGGPAAEPKNVVELQALGVALRHA